MRDNGDLGQGDHYGKKPLNSGYISKVDITRFSEKLDKVKGGVVVIVKQEFKDDSKVFGLSNWKNGIAINQDIEDLREKGFGGKDQELSSGYMLMTTIWLNTIVTRYLDVWIRR